MWRFVLLVLGVILLVVIASVAIPALAVHSYGPPARGLSAIQVLQYSARLLWDDGLLTRPLNRNAPEQAFEVREGEPVESVATRLQLAGAIPDAQALRDYLVYTGLDTSIQSGNYKVSASMSIVDLAHLLQDATPTEVTFVVWPGWRLEEIAQSLPTSGLNIAPYDFASAASSRHPAYDFLDGRTSAEGFLYPDSYILPRTTSVDQLVDALVRNFSLHLTADLRDGFDRQGLSVYQAVTLASIVQREAMHASEGPLIASVYLNRLRNGMKLDADPTVQYALGYNASQQTWWTNPLSASDLQAASPYNTYVAGGLPPTPISNPGPDALRAVAHPESSDYLYFNARCDGSGYHQFAKTFEQHLQHLCP
ncbi:MAG TPA: endolytic transglycosylase MltG [Anaerolineales bacterium]